MMSALFYFQPTLNRLFNNCIKLYWYKISSSWNMKSDEIDSSPQRKRQCLSWVSGGFSGNKTWQDFFDWPDWYSVDHSLFLWESICTVSGCKKRKLSYSPKFSYKIYWANIFHCRFWKINFTKISQKPLIFLIWKITQLNWSIVILIISELCRGVSEPCQTSKSVLQK